MAINLENGAGFQVYLPRLDEAETTQTQSKAPFSPLRVRILYVDDERQTVEAGSKLLEHLGCQVTALTSSLAARQVFHDDPQEFDLVITDLAMPMMSGLQLAADLVELRPDVPIILYSGCSESISREAARQLGIREFIRKPANFLELARAIRRVLEVEER